MRPWLACIPVVVAMLLVGTPHVLRAQWTVGLELGGARYSGATARTTPSADGETFRPAHPTILGLRLTRGTGPVQPGLGLSYAEPDLALEGATAAVLVKDALRVITIAPELGYRLTRHGAAAELRVALGPVLELWDPAGEGYRPRLGGQGAAMLTLPITGRLVGRLRAEVAVVPSSMFEARELPAEYRPAALWRRGVAAGVALRL